MHYKVKYLFKIRINVTNNKFWNSVYCVVVNVVRNVARDLNLSQQHISELHTLKTINTTNQITHQLLTCIEKVQCKESYGNRIQDR